jgi:hypothetical protein
MIHMQYFVRNEACSWRLAEPAIPQKHTHVQVPLQSLFGAGRQRLLR